MRWEWQDERERKEMTELDIEENLDLMNKLSLNIFTYWSLKHPSWDGRVGLRCQIKVLVRKGVGSNPTLNNLFYVFFLLALMSDVVGWRLLIMSASIFIVGGFFIVWSLKDYVLLRRELVVTFTYRHIRWRLSNDTHSATWWPKQVHDVTEEEGTSYNAPNARWEKKKKLKATRVDKRDKDKLDKEGNKSRQNRLDKEVGRARSINLKSQISFRIDNHFYFCHIKNSSTNCTSMGDMMSFLRHLWPYGLKKLPCGTYVCHSEGKHCETSVSDDFLLPLKLVFQG